MTQYSSNKDISDIQTSNIFHVTVSHHNFYLFTVLTNSGFFLKNTLHCHFYMYFLYFLVLNMNKILFFYFRELAMKTEMTQEISLI